MAKILYPEVHQKVWGKEIWIANNPMYCGKILVLYRQYRCSIHYHKLKDETFCIQKGLVLMEVDGEKLVMEQGEIIHIPQQVKHRFTGIIDSEILEISTQHFEDDSYRETKSGFVSNEEFANILNHKKNEIL
jgi:mannose-6-phosphate isomerase-like protein (cupin superfamily)